jgi:hypothetical protein
LPLIEALRRAADEGGRRSLFLPRLTFDEMGINILNVKSFNQKLKTIRDVARVAVSRALVDSSSKR